MKISFYRFLLFAILVLCVSFSVNAQSFNMTIRNVQQVSSTEMQFDIYLLNTNPGVPIKISGIQCGIMVDPAVENGGTLTASLIGGTSEINFATVPAITYQSHAVKIAPALPTSYDQSTTMGTSGDGTRFYRVRIVNSVSFTAKSKPNLTFCFVTNNPYKTKFSYYQNPTTPVELVCDATNCFSVSSDITLNKVQLTAAVPTLTLSKTYDATTTAAVTAGVISGIDAADLANVSVAATALYNSKAAGSGKTITVNYTLSGTAAEKYLAPAAYTSTSGVITAKSISISGVTASGKVYDGTSVASLSGGSLGSQIIAGDVVSLVTGTGAYANKSIGTAKAITASGYTLTGADAANYSLTSQPTGLTATITAKSVTIQGIAAQDKTYNGTNEASLSIGNLGTQIVSGDVVNIVAGTGTFTDKNVGSGKTVNVSAFSLSGGDASNYSLSAQPGPFTAAITAKSITIQGVSAQSKTYDGNNTVVLTSGNLGSQIVSGDNVTLVNGTGVFSDKNAAVGKNVTASGYSLSGSEASNYSLASQPSGLVATISPLQLTISAPTITLSKPFDGTISATAISGILSGLVPSDLGKVVATASGSYENASVGTNKKITVSYTLSGLESANYLAPASMFVTNGEIKSLNHQLTLKAYLQGLVSGTSMVACKKSDGTTPVLSAGIADTLTVELHSASNFRTVVFSLNAVQLHTDGTISAPGLSYLEIPSGYNESYYITLRSRNHFSVTSANSVSFAPESLGYDFSTSASAAYGGRGLVKVGSLYALYAGEVSTEKADSENSIDLSDMILIYNKSISLDTPSSDYVKEDLNGDGIVDLSDLVLIISNISEFVTASIPQ